MSDSPPGGNLLRLGLVVPSLVQPAWVHRLIGDVEASGVGRFVVVAIDESIEPRSPHRRSALQRLYQHLDARLFADAPDRDLVAAADMTALLQDRKVIRSDQAETLRQDGLDVVFVVGSRPAPGVLNAARHGAWTFRHGAADAVGFVEVMEQHSTTASAITRLGELDDLPRVCSWAATERRSTRRTSNRVLAKSSGLAVTALRRLRDGLPPPHCPATPNDAKPGVLPAAARGNLQMVSGMARLVRRFAREKYTDWRYVEQWALGVRWHDRADGPAFDQPPSNYLMPPRDRFWADPFPFEHDGRHFIFVEEFVFGQRNGHISVLEVDARGLKGTATPVVVEEHHLSYPNVFEWDGSIFMTPECQASGRIDLYRALEFPVKWERLNPLMTGVIAADPTIFRRDDTWWMFVNLGVSGVPNYDECHLLWADRLEGPWHAHPLNPVRSDVRCARPAGRLFTRGGKLYRPAQDCSVRYGYATVIHEIERMTRADYAEREVARIEPTWHSRLTGTHTLNHAGGLTVWDCLFKRPR